MRLAIVVSTANISGASGAGQPQPILAGAVKLAIGNLFLGGPVALRAH